MPSLQTHPIETGEFCLSIVLYTGCFSRVKGSLHPLFSTPPGIIPESARHLKACTFSVHGHAVLWYSMGKCFREDSAAMFQRIISFFRRLTGSRGFRRGLRILFWVFVVYFLYNITIYLFAVMRISGVSFPEALRFFLNLPMFPMGISAPSASIALGLAVGLIVYFNRKRKKEAPQESGEKPAEAAEPVQEEEFRETTRYRTH